MLAYDDEYSIQYFKKNLRPYWRRNGDDAAALLKKAATEYESLRKRCEKFDAELMADLHQGRRREVRPALRAGLSPMLCRAPRSSPTPTASRCMFPKENFSNGCIGTVDVIYPMAPQFLLFSPSLTKAMLVPILDYAASPRWSWPFAPHDLGTYPLANGQVYGGGERTEETRCRSRKPATCSSCWPRSRRSKATPISAAHYWPVLEKWAAVSQGQGL